jgi:hypothetical protein
MFHNKNIIDKYTKTNIGDNSFEEIKNDFLKIKPYGIPISDMFLLKFIGDYINKFNIHQKWIVYDKIDIELIEMCREQYSYIIFNDIELKNIIMNLRNKLESTNTVEYKILDFLDKKYKKQYEINENFIDNHVTKVMKYLEFRQNCHTSIKNSMKKYNIEINNLSQEEENILDEIYENFKHLEDDGNTIIVANLIEKIKEKIKNKITKIEKEYIELNLEESEFSKKIDEICKSILKEELNYINEDLLELFDKMLYIDKMIYIMNFNLASLIQKFT